MIIETQQEKVCLDQFYDLMPVRMKAIYIDACNKFEHNNFKRLSKDQIIKIVCQVMDVHIDTLPMKTRKREIVTCRQMTYLFLSLYFGYSLTYLGRLFNQDHATVVHAKKNILDLIESSKEIRSYYEQINKKIYEIE